MKLIILNGSMGVGKLTTANKLADVTGYPILHNHLTKDLATSFFKVNSEAYTRFLWTMRLSIVRELISEKCPGLIWTAVLQSEPAIRKYYSELEEIVHNTGGEIYYARLFCELEEQKKRVVSEERLKHKKITTVEELEKVMKNRELYTATPPERTIEIDNTHLTPDEVAKKIRATFNLDEKNKELGNEINPLDNSPFKLH